MIDFHSKLLLYKIFVRFIFSALILNKILNKKKQYLLFFYFYLTLIDFRRCHGLVLSGVDKDFRILGCVIDSCRDIRRALFTIFRFVFNDVK